MVKRVGILGALGFTGKELLKILARHEKVEVVYASSSEYANQNLILLFPELYHPRYENLVLKGHEEENWPGMDLVFLCTPENVSLSLVPKFLEKGVKVIDLSGAFRIKNPSTFLDYYGIEHKALNLLPQAVYGLPEIFRKEIEKAHLVANPGCYPTAFLLSLFSLKKELTDLKSPVIVDAKSGTSGAGGRKEKDNLPYSSVNENFKAYRIKKHQHVPEMEEKLQEICQNEIKVRFCPHLLPLYRGILTNVFLYFQKNVDFLTVENQVKNFAQREKFLRYYENPDDVELRKVQNTNFFDFSMFWDERCQILQIVSAMDNLQKGAAGQAVQNMNLMFGFPEDMGLI